MGQLRPRPAKGDSAMSIALPAPVRQGRVPLMEEMARRQSSRSFAPDALPLPAPSEVLWESRQALTARGRYRCRT